MSTVHRMGKAVEKDANENFATFSVRISRELADQIEARCKVSKRSKNKEIELMLEQQIKAEAEYNEKVLAEIDARNKR